MDRDRRCGGRHFEKEEKHFRNRTNSGKKRRRRGADRYGWSNSEENGDQASCSGTSDTRTESLPTDIPGYFFDAEKNRYFKITKDFPRKPADKSSNIPVETVKRRLPAVHAPLLPQFFQSRELSNDANTLRRCGLEQWARRLVERNAFALTSAHPFEGCISHIALSSNNSKMATAMKLPGLNCDTINVYNINDDKDAFMLPEMLVTVIASEVTHIEWNQNKNMEHYILFSLLGSEKSKGCGLVCKFTESLDSCDFHSFPVPTGSAWHCCWCSNPLYSHLLGIAGTKQAVLIDFVKRTSFCKISSLSDVFCIEFCHRSPVVYLGCRNGDMMCVDIRMKSNKQNKPFNMNATRSSNKSTTWIKMMQDENYLMASNIDGMIKMWDVRLSKPVKEYCGNVNETKLIPFVMDSTQNLIASAGQDGKTRIWSVGSCELLNTIDYPQLNSDDLVNIPPVCLGEHWGNKGGMMAYGLGVNDKLNIYF